MDSSTWLGVVLYDDLCGFCRRWIPFWKRTLALRGLSIAPLQTPWVRNRLALSEAELSRDLRLLLPDGRQIIGADVYRVVLQRIWCAYPLYLLAVMPLVRRFFDWAYRNVADNRLLISESCGLHGERRRVRSATDY